MAFAGGNHRGRVLSSLSGTTMPASTTTSKSVEDTGILSGHWEPPPRVVTKCDCVWHIDNLVVRADFESANLSDASCSSSTSVPELLVRTRPDCAGTEFETSNKSWFYFSVQGMSSGDAMRVTVANLNKQAKLFVGGFKPVYRVFNRKTGRGSGRWRRVAGELNYDAQVKGDFRITFDFPSAAVRGCDDEVYIAFAIPWSLSQDAASLSRAQQRFDSASRPFIFTREELCLSLEARPVDVLTITSAETGREERPVFIVTSRVHPGETPASHMCNGILDFLLRIRDERARAARKAFVFKIVTIINPDGVANGHYRCDTRGVNLNRCYENPDPSLHPSVHAVKSLIVTNAPAFVIDLHAHANKKGCFAFGNAIPNTDRRAECICFAKLAAMNCAFFDFGACNFTERNMMSRDKGGSTTKEGSARVAIYRETGITHIYTVEANYNSGRVQSGNFSLEGGEGVGRGAPRPLRTAPNGKGGGESSTPNTGSVERDCGAVDAMASMALSSSAQYDEASFACMGRCLIIAALDLVDANPASTMRRWSLKTLSALRCWAQQYVRKSDTSGGGSIPGFSFGRSAAPPTDAKPVPQSQLSASHSRLQSDDGIV